MKIGILYIGIGRYACFWPDFYNSCQKNLVPEADKYYYVFTDTDKNHIEPSDHIMVFHQDDMGWPCNSLFRFKMFKRIEEQLKSNDYLFFFNANVVIVSTISAKDILPSDEEEYSALCISTDITTIVHESRQSSASYIAPYEATCYFSGALNGGKCMSYIKLINDCDKLVDVDLENGIMPIWHDETVLNKFLHGKNIKMMYRDMGKPENWRKPRNAKIILRRKESVLGRNWLRNYKGRPHTNTWLRKLLNKIGIIK